MPRSQDRAREGFEPSPHSISPSAVARVNLCYLWRHGRLPDLVRPRRFTEWVQRRKLYDRDVGLAQLTDKLYAKALARAHLGDDCVIPTLWHGHELPALAPGPFPLMVKANHGCNQYRVVRDGEEWRRARDEAARWVTSAYGGWLDEWHYRAARRMIIVEPFVGQGMQLPRDYKIYVFGGTAQCVQVHVDRATEHRWMQFDRGWRPLSRPLRDVPPPPATLPEMLAAAEAIAGARDFLRVDFYEIEGRLLFGEACLFPGSGLDPFDPVELDFVLGEHWRSAAGLPPASRPEPVHSAPGATAWLAAHVRPLFWSAMRR